MAIPEYIAVDTTDGFVFRLEETDRESVEKWARKRNEHRNTPSIVVCRVESLGLRP